MFLLSAFVFFLVIQLYFYGFVFGKYSWLESQPRVIHPVSPDPHIKDDKYSPPSVSVVVCARNEAANLKLNLQSLGEQNYPNYEIVLVDDGSTDDTSKVIEEFISINNTIQRPIRSLRIPINQANGKKRALTEGIQLAKNKVILLTDADCSPSSKNWIAIMTSQLQAPSEIVLGYGGYRKSDSWLNKLIRYETLLTAIQYFSYALQGQAYMGVGRNLAYKKELFERTGGFISHAKVRSGDDDLFVNEASTSENTCICDHPEAFTLSEPENDFSSWVRQKRRHVTTSHHYASRQKLKLGAFFLSQIGFYTAGTAVLLFNNLPLLVVGLILLRYVFFYLSVIGAAKKLQEKDLIPLAPLYEISIIFMQLYVFAANTFSPPKRW